jgi:hypothetical protein
MRGPQETKSECSATATHMAHAHIQRFAASENPQVTDKDDVSVQTRRRIFTLYPSYQDRVFHQAHAGLSCIPLRVVFASQSRPVVRVLRAAFPCPARRLHALPGRHAVYISVSLEDQRWQLVKRECQEGLIRCQHTALSTS